MDACDGRVDVWRQAATAVTTAGPGSSAHQGQHVCTRNMLHCSLMLCAANLPPQAAIELFPSAGISPLTAETHRQWMGSEPQRVKVTLPGLAIAAAGLNSANLQHFVRMPWCAIAVSGLASSLPGDGSDATLCQLQVVLFTDKEDPPALFRALRSAAAERDARLHTCRSWVVSLPSCSATLPTCRCCTHCRSANFRKFKFNFGMVHSSQAALLKEFRVEKVCRHGGWGSCCRAVPTCRA